MTKVVVEQVPGQPYLHLLKARTHTVMCDAPKFNKGGDIGPSPHELFLLGLGACTAMTVEMYAAARGLSLTRITVTVDEDLVDDPDRAGTKIPRIVETLEVEGNLSAAELQKLKDIAEKCPVYKLFIGKKLVETQISHKVAKP